MNLDFNIVGETVNGDKEDIPTYLYPFISMRGIPIMRYQGEHIITAQSQFSYSFTPRWKGLLFGGAGRAFGEQVAAPEHTFQ